MKYIYSFLILIGGLAALCSLLCLIFWLTDKVRDWKFNFMRKHEKYRLFTEKFNGVMEWIIFALMLCFLMFGFVLVYFKILQAI
jgi:uncharacterized membrane protein